MFTVKLSFSNPLCFKRKQIKRWSGIFHPHQWHKVIPPSTFSKAPSLVSIEQFHALSKALDAVNEPGTFSKAPS